jgi:hypothetical protein
LFPGIRLPIKNHVENIKDLIEKIIPDPKDRTEELFSGKSLPFSGHLPARHKIRRKFSMERQQEILNAIDGDCKGNLYEL